MGEKIINSFIVQIQKAPERHASHLVYAIYHTSTTAALSSRGPTIASKSQLLADVKQHSSQIACLLLTTANQRHKMNEISSSVLDVEKSVVATGAMMGQIFISYRQDDSRDFTARIVDHLKWRFGKDAVFQDIASIPPAAEYRTIILNSVVHADIEIVVLGQHWLSSSNEAGGRRLDEDDDLVRAEIETALSYGVPIVPVLIDGATMPSAANLPSTIEKLAGIQAVSLRRNGGFDRDMQELGGAIQRERLTMVRRGRRAVRRYGTTHPEIIKRSMIAAIAVLLIGFSGIALMRGTVLRLPILWGGGRSISSGSPSTTASGSSATLPPAASITSGWSTTHPGWITLTLWGFPPGSYVIDCDAIGEKGTAPTVTQFSVTVETNPQTFDDGRTCYGAQNGDEIWVQYDTLASTPIPVALAVRPATLTPIATPTSGVFETVGDGEAHTWSNYTDAGGSQGPDLSPNARVQVSCKVTGFKVADGNTWWYRIAQSPWNNAYYASADTFYNNGQTSGSLEGTPFVDLKVPDC